MQSANSPHCLWDVAPGPPVPDLAAGQFLHETFEQNIKCSPVKVTFVECNFSQRRFFNILTALMLDW